MPRKRCGAEQIIPNLRVAEVDLAKVLAVVTDWQKKIGARDATAGKALWR